MNAISTPFQSVAERGFIQPLPLQHFPAAVFPTIHPIHWLHSHFAVGGWSPLQRLSGMLTAHMTQIAPRNGFTWHPHKGLEIYTWVLEGVLSHEDSTGGKGDIGAGDLQRMLAGPGIEHQEINNTDDFVRVIQIWYAAAPEARSLPPQYQQVNQSELPATRHGAATIYDLIGGRSPMEAHMYGRLTAAALDADGTTWIQTPDETEDLFLYVTDGSGTLSLHDEEIAVGQYDVILARADASAAPIQAGASGLHFLSFYLPRFIPLR